MSKNPTSEKHFGSSNRSTTSKRPPVIKQYFPEKPDQHSVAELLHERLLSLPFDAYVRLVALLLERLGYENVSPAGRTDWKGRNHSGGVDLIAFLPGGLTPRRVVIQIKQFDRYSRVFQRHVDELCGVAIRCRASEALLITTGPASTSIHFDGLISPLLPMRLIDGEQLLTLLIDKQVGVTHEGEIDQSLLDRLTRMAKGNSREDCPGRPEVVVNVEVIAHSKKRQKVLQRASFLTPA